VLAGSLAHPIVKLLEGEGHYSLPIGHSEAILA